jgi:inorganic triphosphatase YgiF
VTEIELKLALPLHAAGSLARRVASLPALKGLASRRETLDNTYYDTPDHALLRQGAVLRVRQVRRGGKTLWLQTFKTSDRQASALSRRGEWESPLDGPALSAALLRDTPWQLIDPDGRLFGQLQACFSTRFTRRRWLCQRPDAGVIELALDIGAIVSGDRSVPIQELELELKAGPAHTLLALARELGADLPCIPATRSKSERGYALAGYHALPDAAHSDDAQAVPDLRLLAGATLHEAFSQFTSRLIDLSLADDPDHVHQARVGWRRFRSARRLFKPVLRAAPDLALDGLQPLLDALTELRELDVAHTESLPALGPAYIGGDTQRALAWEALMEDLGQDRVRARARVRALLAQAASAQALLAVTTWLDGVETGQEPAAERHATGESRRAWARQRVRRLGRDLRQACRQLDDAQSQHRARILAKRLRYGVESLRALLPAARARRWHRRAQRWQAALGGQRDLSQALERVARLPRHQAIAEFLRGYQAGQACGAKPAPRT